MSKEHAVLLERFKEQWAKDPDSVDPLLALAFQEIKNPKTDRIPVLEAESEEKRQDLEQLEDEHQRVISELVNRRNEVQVLQGELRREGLLAPQEIKSLRSEITALRKILETPLLSSPPTTPTYEQDEALELAGLGWRKGV